MKRNIAIVVLVIATLNTSFQQRSNLEFSAKLGSPIVNTQNDLTIKLLFRNTGDVNILVVKRINWGFKDSTRLLLESDLIWELEKLGKNEFVEQPITLTMTPVPFYVSPKVRYDTLSPKKELKLIFPLYEIYQLPKGTYRVRGKYISPVEAGLGNEYYYSEWYLFTVSKRLL